MEIRTYETKTKLDGLNNKQKIAVNAELKDQIEENKITINDFFRTSDQVFVFDGEYGTAVKGFRIDCAVATDKTLYPGAAETIYYLQLQHGKKTYAHVLFPEREADGYDVTTLRKAIKLSMKENKGVYIALN